MNRHFWIPLAGVLLCVAIVIPWAAMAAGGAGGFDGVVDAIEDHYHAHATRIPLMGLASLVANSTTHGGVSGVRVAEFEQFPGPVDGAELNQIVEEKLGQGWGRIIRETSRKGAEQTLIFARPEDKLLGLFIVDLDKHEMDVVEVSVDPDQLNETINKYEHRAQEEDSN
jgi:hypothetical protein